MSDHLKPPMCLHPEVRYDAENDNYYCQSCHGGMGLAYYKVARERDGFKSSLGIGVTLMEEFVEDKKKQDAQLAALKTTLTNLLNAAAILHGQSPDSTAKTMVGAELDIAEKALK